MHDAAGRVLAMEKAKYNSLSFSHKLARFCVLLHRAYPFLGELCMRIEKYNKEEYTLAATDGVRLYLNVDELNKLPEESVNFVLLHELLHIILRHRFPKDIPFYEKMYWNIAFDLVANWMLMSMSGELKFRELPIIPVKGTFLTADDLSKDPSEVIAKTFVRQAIDQGILSEDPPLFVDIEWKSFKYKILDVSSFIFDILDGNATGDATDDASGEAEIGNLLASCAKSAGIYGLPWCLRGLWNEIVAYKKLPWYLILKRYLEGMRENEDFDFCPPDKRTLYRDLIAPAEIMEEGGELNDALIVLDVSGSVGKDELLAQIWQVRCILTELDFKGSIISFGSSVYQEAKLSGKQSLKEFIDTLEAGGGTQWSSVVDYVKKNKRNARPIIVFTDGYLFSYDEGLSDVIFITQDDYPHQLDKLGKVIQVNK